MRVVGIMIAVLLLAACGDTPASDEPTAPDNAVDGEGDDVLEGTLGGDPRLEGGCAWLDTGDGRFEVVYPDGYDIVFEPVRLLDPEGRTVAEEGDVVRVRGRVADDLMSVCQVGTIFEAEQVQ